jgi:hypothetical protein
MVRRTVWATDFVIGAPLRCAPAYGVRKEFFPVLFGTTGSRALTLVTCWDAAWEIDALGVAAYGALSLLLTFTQGLTTPACAEAAQAGDPDTHLG